MELEIRMPQYALCMSRSGYACHGYLMFGQACPHPANLYMPHTCTEPWKLERNGVQYGALQQLEALTRYIDARCADLLEPSQGRIVFIHRTAREFLGRRDNLDTLSARAGADFDVGLSLARIFLTGIKCQSKYESSGTQQSDFGLPDCQALVRAANTEQYMALRTEPAVPRPVVKITQKGEPIGKDLEAAEALIKHASGVARSMRLQQGPSASETDMGRYRVALNGQLAALWIHISTIGWRPYTQSVDDSMVPDFESWASCSVEPADFDERRPPFNRLKHVMAKLEHLREVFALYESGQSSAGLAIPPTGLAHAG